MKTSIFPTAYLRIEATSKCATFTINYSCWKLSLCKVSSRNWKVDFFGEAEGEHGFFRKNIVKMKYFKRNNVGAHELFSEYSYLTKVYVVHIVLTQNWFSIWELLLTPFFCPLWGGGAYNTTNRSIDVFFNESFWRFEESTQQTFWCYREDIFKSRFDRLSLYGFGFWRFHVCYLEKYKIPVRDLFYDSSR